MTETEAESKSDTCGRSDRNIRREQSLDYKPIDGLSQSAISSAVECLSYMASCMVSNMVCRKLDCRSILDVVLINLLFLCRSFTDLLSNSIV